MSEARKRGRRPLLSKGVIFPPLLPPDAHEIARFLRPQPPYEIPARSGPAHIPGLIALDILGYRVIRRIQGSEA